MWNGKLLPSSDPGIVRTPRDPAIENDGPVCLDHLLDHRVKFGTLLTAKTDGAIRFGKLGEIRH